MRNHTFCVRVSDSPLLKKARCRDDVTRPETNLRRAQNVHISHCRTQLLHFIRLWRPRCQKDFQESCCSLAIFLLAFLSLFVCVLMCPLLLLLFDQQVLGQQKVSPFDDCEWLHHAAASSSSQDRTRVCVGPRHSPLTAACEPTAA